MRRDDTQIGGSQDRFPGTRYSAIVAARSLEPEERRRGFATLIAAYWKPVYKYLRIQWKSPPEDAKDLVQSFFALAMEKGYFDRFDPAKAGFRTFLCTCLDGFVANERKAARRIKRGGGHGIVSLDFEEAEGEFSRIEVPGPDDVQKYFEKEWVRSLFSLSVTTLRDRCEKSGKTVHFQLFEAYDLDAPMGGERCTYDDLAKRHGIPVTQVTNHLSAIRREFRGIVLDHLRSLCGSEQEFRTEAAALLRQDGS